MIRMSNYEKSLLIISTFSENSETRLLVKNKEWEELLGVKDTEKCKDSRNYWSILNSDGKWHHLMSFLFLSDANLGSSKFFSSHILLHWCRFRIEEDLDPIDFFFQAITNNDKQGVQR